MREPVSSPPTWREIVTERIRRLMSAGAALRTSNQPLDPTTPESVVVRALTTDLPGESSPPELLTEILRYAGRRDAGSPAPSRRRDAPSGAFEHNMAAHWAPGAVSGQRDLPEQGGLPEHSGRPERSGATECSGLTEHPAVPEYGVPPQPWAPAAYGGHRPAHTAGASERCPAVERDGSHNSEPSLTEQPYGVRAFQRAAAALDHVLPAEEAPPLHATGIPSRDTMPAPDAPLSVTPTAAGSMNHVFPPQATPSLPPLIPSRITQPPAYGLTGPMTRIMTRPEDLPEPADDLGPLAEKIKRILEDEARRFGIDV